jgi:hypothetical protein
MGKDKWEVIIADAPHRNDLFAEIWINEIQMGEVFMEENDPIIEIYKSPVDDCWQLKYNDLLAIMGKIDEFLASLLQK